MLYSCSAAQQHARFKHMSTGELPQVHSVLGKIESRTHLMKNCVKKPEYNGIANCKVQDKNRELNMVTFY